jgi:hypothetical protein
METHVQGGGSSSRAVGLGRKVFERAANVNEKGCAAGVPGASRASNH